MLLDALDAQCPRDLPKAEARKGSPSVGMCDLLVRTLIPEGILVCASSNESTINAPLDSQAQDAVKNTYADSVLLSFDYIPRPTDAIAAQPKRSWYWPVVFGDKPEGGIAFCILETPSKSESSHGRSAKPLQQFDHGEKCGEHQQGGNKACQDHSQHYRSDDPTRVGHREVEKILSSRRSYSCLGFPRNQRLASRESEPTEEAGLITLRISARASQWTGLADGTAQGWPLPSRRFTIRSTAICFQDSQAPASQWTWIRSTSDDWPSPKWTLGSLAAK
jgi:hypothetical protein